MNANLGPERERGREREGVQVVIHQNNFNNIVTNTNVIINVNANIVLHLVPVPTLPSIKSILKRNVKPTPMLCYPQEEVVPSSSTTSAVDDNVDANNLPSLSPSKDTSIATLVNNSNSLPNSNNNDNDENESDNRNDSGTRSAPSVSRSTTITGDGSLLVSENKNACSNLYSLNANGSSENDNDNALELNS